MAQWIEFTVALNNGLGYGKGTIISDLLLVENKHVLLWGNWPVRSDNLPEYARGAITFNDTGFHPDYQDGMDQVHHAMFFTLLGASGVLGPYAAGCGNLLHETIDPQPWLATGDFWYGKSIADYKLGVRAMGLGLLWRRVPEAQWGDWTRLYFTTGFVSMYPNSP